MTARDLAVLALGICLGAGVALGTQWAMATTWGPGVVLGAALGFLVALAGFIGLSILAWRRAQPVADALGVQRPYRTSPEMRQRLRDEQKRQALKYNGVRES